ncbi:hypothetical protein ABK040_008176 [Willaertia magna]
MPKLAAIALGIPASIASFLTFALSVVALGITGAYLRSSVVYETYVANAIYILLNLAMLGMAIACTFLPRFRFLLGIPYLILSSLNLGYSIMYAIFFSPLMRFATATRNYNTDGAAANFQFSTGVINSVLTLLPIMHAIRVVSQKREDIEKPRTSTTHP